MVLVGAGQLCSSANLVENGVKAASLIVKAADLGCKVLFLPEASDYISSNSRSIVKSFETSPFVLKVQSTLRDLHKSGKFIDVAVGIHEPSNEEPLEDGLARTRNTLVYLNSKGELVERYQKIHLFDVDVPNGPILKESNTVQPGNKVCEPVKTPAGLLGLAICYDLRFPELALALRSKGAEILTYPSAWTMKTGPHFQPLGQAVAIYTQSYVVLPAQKGFHGGNRESFGHTCIIDPNGSIVAQCSDIISEQVEDLCVADIDLSNVELLRNKMPLWNQRRPDVFS